MTEPTMTHAEAIELAGGYVLGALERAEEAAVRAHLASCPEAHDEFAELGGVVPYLVQGRGIELVEPPASLRDRVMAAAAADLADRRAAPAAPSAAAPPATGQAPVPFPSLADRQERAERAARRPRASRFDWALRIAAVVAVVALAGWNLLLQGELDRSRQYDRAVADVVAAAAEPGSQTVVLKPGEASAVRGIAAIRADGSVVLAVRDLAQTTGSQVYEAWLIPGADAAPVPVGSFTPDANGTAAAVTTPTDAPPGSILALSLEPQPGSTTPLGPIVSSGVGSAPPS
jgi:anti-sigma-K factor RskA